MHSDAYRDPVSIVLELTRSRGHGFMGLRPPRERVNSTAPLPGDAPITCQPLFWGSGVKTAGRTLMSHSMLEDRLL